jgi:hypothetical protein
MEQSVVEQVAQGLGSAYWNLNLSRFCEVLDWHEDDWSKNKFLQFRELALALDRFDPATLTKLVNWKESRQNRLIRDK